jgi:hypothetical protein
MKLKYYLRGFGLGIILTMVIMMIITHSSRQELSNAEIIEKAEKLGMQMAEQNSESEKVPEKELEKETETKTETETETETDSVPAPVVENISIVVNQGDSSDAVAGKLQSAGLVENAKAFNQFLIERKYDGILLTGTFVIPKGATTEEIAAILIKKR